jgi:hypothetical protein
MPKPRLPREIELRIPPDVLHYMYGYLAPEPRIPQSPPSPGLQRELTLLQGKSNPAMFLMDLDDFILDKPVVKKQCGPPSRKHSFNSA